MGHTTGWANMIQPVIYEALALDNPYLPMKRPLSLSLSLSLSVFY